MNLQLRLPLIIAVLIFLPASVVAQSGWSTNFGGTLTVDGIVRSIDFDDEGRVYIGGTFEFAGGVQAHGLARWDGQNWEGLGSEAMEVSAIHLDKNLLYVAGYNNEPHAHAVQVAQWESHSLRPIGQFREECCGFNDIYVLTTDKSGKLYVGGDFNSADTLRTKGLTTWDGMRWNSMGSEIRGRYLLDYQLDAVHDMVVRDTSYYIGGNFNAVGNQQTLCVARWDGKDWHALGTGLGRNNYESVNALVMGPTGILYAGGYFEVAGDRIVNNVAQWDGQNWQPLGQGITGSVTSLAADEDYLYAAGFFTQAGEHKASSIARWDGTTWQPLGQGINGRVQTIALGPDGMLYAGGSFTAAGDVPAVNLARWTGTQWESVGAGTNDGFNGSVMAIAAKGDKIYAGGMFTAAGGIPAWHIAKREGQAWQALGDGLNDTVRAIAVAPDGTLVAGGHFTAAGGSPANHIALWDGIQWHPLGEGLDDLVEDVAIDSQGQIYATGRFLKAGEIEVNRIAMWDGQQWHPLGTGLNRAGRALALDSKDQLYAGGYFTVAGQANAIHIATWNGLAWQSLGTGVGSSSPHSSDHVGDIVIKDDTAYVAGNFDKIGDARAGHIARWNGIQWKNLSNGNHSWLTELVVTDQGEIYVSGFGLGPFKNQFVARRNKDEWENLGEGINGLPRSLLAHNNALYIGGAFTQAGDNSSNYFAIWREATSTSLEPDLRKLNEAALLHSLYPNPFSTNAHIAVQLPYSSWLTIEVSNLLGHKLAVVTDRYYQAGLHHIPVDNLHLANGTYLYRIIGSGRAGTGVFQIVK